MIQTAPWVSWSKPQTAVFKQNKDRFSFLLPTKYSEILGDVWKCPKGPVRIWTVYCIWIFFLSPSLWACNPPVYQANRSTKASRGRLLSGSESVKRGTFKCGPEWCLTRAFFSRILKSAMESRVRGELEDWKSLHEGCKNPSHDQCFAFSIEIGTHIKKMYNS